MYSTCWKQKVDLYRMTYEILTDRQTLMITYYHLLPPRCVGRDKFLMININEKYQKIETFIIQYMHVLNMF